MVIELDSSGEMAPANLPFAKYWLAKLCPLADKSLAAAASVISPRIPELAIKRAA
jgi:hypothetical protein